ncbi:MAG: ethanolamine permease, partial [Mucilaginibacter sp.]|nr:ethanolamine permease [Mucilaginibacter sp.]
KSNSLTKVFASIGLFGLIASFHAMILASSRQVFALARSGYLPWFLSTINHKFKTPHWSIIGGGVVSFIALYTGTTGQVVILSVMGAVLMYMMSMISLFVLRVKEPDLERPFASPFYPVFPVIACIILVITFIAIIYYQFELSLIFFAGLVIAIIVFMLMGKHKVEITDDVLLEKQL